MNMKQKQKIIHRYIHLDKYIHVHIFQSIHTYSFFIPCFFTLFSFFILPLLVTVLLVLYVLLLLCFWSSIIQHYCVILLSTFLSSMNTRHPPTHKFFRRTSKSPWQQSRTPLSPDPQTLCLELIHSPCPSNLQKITADRHKQCSISIANIPDESSPNTETLKYIGQTGCQKYSGSEKFNRNIGQYRGNTKTNEQIKFTYIPLESMSTLHTLPSTQKRISDFSQPLKSTVSMEQFTSLRKQIDTLNNQLRHSVQKQKQKTNQNMKLSKQLENVKKNNHTLEMQNKKIREGFNQIQRNLKLSQISAENYKKNLDVSQFRREKAEENVRQLTQNGLKLETQLRFYQQRNGELARLLNMKQNEIMQINAELEKQAKKMKSLLQMSQQSEPKALRQRSTTYYQNNQQENRNIQSKQKQSTKQGPKWVQKCSRYIQTENSNLQKSLKQVESLTSCLEHKMNMINKLKEETEQLNYKVKDFDAMTVKLEQFEVLVEALNEKIIRDQCQKLAAKYRYC